MLLSEAPVLETMHLKLSHNIVPEDHERWVNTAVARHVRHLEILHYTLYIGSLLEMPLPMSLFTCKTLVSLRLQRIDIPHVPREISLNSLKTLSLVRVRFCSEEEFVCRLLSACPNLETLVVCRNLNDIPITYTIAVPSLQTLYIMERRNGHKRNDGREYVINAPCLKTLRVFDKCCRFRSLVKMPKLINAELRIRQEDSIKLLECLTSAKHLTLCLTSSIPLLKAKSLESLCCLEYLELCTNCSSDWLCLLLKHSPKLRVLKLTHRNCGLWKDFEAHWEEPCCVPECLVSSLETVEWIGYTGTGAEKEAAVYILEKASHLKKMTLSRNITSSGKKYRMLIDLMSRLSCSCKFRLLEFVPLKKL